MKPSPGYTKRTIKATRRRRTGRDPEEILDTIAEFGPRAKMPKRNRPKAKKLRNK